VQRITGFLFFQWGNSITQNASLPLPYPLKVVTFSSFASNHVCPTENPLYPAWKIYIELKAIRKQGNCRKEKSSSFEAEATNAEQKLWLLLHF
jgi:hypothetical protein